MKILRILNAFFMVITILSIFLKKNSIIFKNITLQTMKKIQKLKKIQKMKKYFGETSLIVYSMIIFVSSIYMDKSCLLLRRPLAGSIKAVHGG